MDHKSGPLKWTNKNGPRKISIFLVKKYAEFPKKDFECARHTFFVFEEKMSKKLRLRDIKRKVFRK